MKDALRFSKKRPLVRRFHPRLMHTCVIVNASDAHHLSVKPWYLVTLVITVCRRVGCGGRNADGSTSTVMLRACPGSSQRDRAHHVIPWKKRQRKCRRQKITAMICLVWSCVIDSQRFRIDNFRPHASAEISSRSS
jgi:hypothetical protein